MIIKCFAAGPLDTNVYVLGCEKTKEAAIIDPSFDSLSTIMHLVDSLGLKPAKVLLTHSHFDHIADAKAVVDRFHIPLFVHSLDKDNVIRPGSDGIPLFSPIEGLEPTGFLEEGKPVTIGEIEAKIIHTPGHTPGGVCFYFPQEGVLISGDTLFQGSIGNLALPTAEPDKMWPTLDKLAALPPKTRVYPGHGPATTIWEEEWLKNAQKLFSKGEI
jgi:hydroxyacylglutathione hydrolase